MRYNVLAAPAVPVTICAALCHVAVSAMVILPVDMNYGSQSTSADLGASRWLGLSPSPNCHAWFACKQKMEWAVLGRVYSRRYVRAPPTGTWLIMSKFIRRSNME
jgi:hypothetical protein